MSAAIVRANIGLPNIQEGRDGDCAHQIRGSADILARAARIFNNRIFNQFCKCGILFILRIQRKFCYKSKLWNS